MNKEIQLRKLIREELMKEGLFDKAKDYAQGIARSYMDDIKSATGYKKVELRIGIEYYNEERMNGDEMIQLMDLSRSRNFSSAERSVASKFEDLFYSVFRSELDPNGVDISTDKAEKISEFLTNNSFTKTERNTSNGRLEVFTGNISLKDINDMRGL